MSAVETFLANNAPAEPERDRWGRYLIPHPHTGKKTSWTRATTISATLAEKFNLQLWSQRMTALGLAKRPDLYARVAACGVEDKQQLNKLCDEAKEAAAASAGANLGTALHRFTERLDRGEDITAPSPLDRDLAAYRDGLTQAQFTVVPDMIEQVVTVPSIGVAGTFDRLGTLAGRPLPMVADLKTGQWLGWDEIALQLAIYANAETIFDLRAGEHLPMPTVDREHALVIHLPAGQATCTLWLVDIAAGWDAVQQAMWVREWRKRKDLATAVASAASQRSEEKPSDAAGVASDSRLLDTLIGANLRRKVEAMDTEQRLALSVEMATRGLPRLSEATPEHQEAWVQAVKTITGPTLPEPRVLESGTVMHAPPTREWLRGRVETLVGIEGGIPALQNALAAVLLPKLSECPDELLDEWADACSNAERQVQAPFPPSASEPVDAGGEIVRLVSLPASAPPELAEAISELDDDMAAVLLTVTEMDHLAALVNAIDRGVVGFTYEPDAALMTTERAFDAICEACGSKGEALRAGQALARQLARPVPRTATGIADDPLLVAVLTHQPNKEQ